MFVGGELNKRQLTELRKALADMDMPPKKRQRLLWRIAKYGVIAAAKRNVRNQQSPDGQKWPGRKTKRKGKMLRNLPKLLHIREMPEIEAVRIYLQGGCYRNSNGPVPAAVVGYAHANGMSATITREHFIASRAKKNAESEKNKPKTESESDPESEVKMASAAQAKKLRALGYRVRTGKRWKKPTLGEITQTMSYNQAGLLIRKLSGKAVKTSWTVELPARAFLGINDDEFNNALARQLQAIGFGWNVKAQDIKGKT